MIFKKDRDQQGTDRPQLLKKRKKFKSRKLAGILCFVLAGIFAFGVLPVLYSSKNNTGIAVQVVEPIKKGQVISEDQIAEKEIGIYGMPKDVVAESRLVKGKTARTDMFAGDLVTRKKFGDYVSDPVIESYQKEGKILVSVTLQSNASGLASHLEPGDIVSVFNVVEDEVGIRSVQGDPELQSLEVYDLENAEAVSIKDTKQGGESTSVDGVAKTITFAATPSQGAKLISAEYKGQIHVAFVRREGRK